MSMIVTKVEGPATERQIAFDMIKRAIPVAPALLLVAGLIWGMNGVASSAFAIGLVLMNFVLAAAIMAWAARISLAVLMGAVLFGYIARRRSAEEKPVGVAVQVHAEHVVAVGRKRVHH